MRGELRRFAFAYRGVLAASQGRRPSELGGPSLRGPRPDEDAQARQAVKVLHAKAVLADALRTGAPLEQAVVDMTRALLAARFHVEARSVCQALQSAPSTRTAGALGAGLVASAMGLVELAHEAFREVPQLVRRDLVVVEYVRTAMELGDEGVVAEVRSMIDDGAMLAPGDWLGLTKAAFGFGHTELARDLARHAAGLRQADLGAWSGPAPEWDWLQRWLDREPGRRAEPATSALAFGVIDYKQPDRAHTSSNLGDYVQSVAALGHLLRHDGIEIDGDDDLARSSRQLQERVRADARLASPTRRVQLHPVNRDASNLDVLPEPTWMLAFGWYMHDWFGGRTDFPFHPAIRPVFVSFHCNRRTMLSDEALDYLRRYGPVGCRDWNTVHLLLSADVPAFFSGCLTTTVGTVFPDRATGRRHGTVYVDTPAPSGSTTISQAADEVRDGELGATMLAAVELLERYRGEFERVVTSRLHCYLPARAIGADVEFRPTNPADVRFTGLLDAAPPDLDRMRDRITGLLEPVTAALVEGVAEDEVYRRWREACAPHVARAEQVHRSVTPLDGPSFDVAEACRTVRAAAVTVPGEDLGPEQVDVALALDENLKDELDVVVTAMLANTSRPLHLWILSRGHDAVDHARFAATFPEVTTTWLPCDDVDYGPVLGMLKHITVSTMDRLLLPELLPELDRIVYHDVDALPLGDLAELVGWDLAGAPLAARSSVARHVRSGYDTVHLTARRLREDPRAASDLLHRMYATHPWDFDAFNAGILVLDLAQLRREGFTHTALPFVECYGMNDQEVLNCYVGARRAELGPQWNSLPTQEPVRDPKVIHWAGPLKPWLPPYVAFREVWQSYEDKADVRRRRARDSRTAPVADV